MPSVRTEIYAYTRPVYSKTGKLKIETTIQAVNRDVLTGRIVTRTSGKFYSQKSASAFIQQVKTGEISGPKAFGILKGRGKRSNEELVKSGFRSLIQMYEDKIPISDYNRDKLAYMAEKMDWEDFEEFYNRNPDLVQKVYRVGSPRARERDGNITMPTEYERNYTTDLLLDEMQKFLNISDAELDANVNPQDYTDNGRRKQGRTVPKFSKRFYA